LSIDTDVTFFRKSWRTHPRGDYDAKYVIYFRVDFHNGRSYELWHISDCCSSNSFSSALLARHMWPQWNILLLPNGTKMASGDINENKKGRNHRVHSYDIFRSNEPILFVFSTHDQEYAEDSRIYPPAEISMNV